MEVPPQGEIEFSPDDNDDGPGGRSTTFLHLTNMALSSDGKDTGACSLKIQVDGGRALVLGTLGRAIGLYQYPLDVVIDGVAKFTNSGKTGEHFVQHIPMHRCCLASSNECVDRISPDLRLPGTC